MKVFCLLFVFILVQNAFASQLIYKTVLDTKAGLLNETPRLNTSSFRQIRVYIKKELRSDKIDEEEYFFVNIYAIDDERELLLTSSDKMFSVFNLMYEVPPPVTKISITGQGKFYIYVWGS